MSDALPSKVTKPGYDDLLEDVLGLNVRGIKTLWTSIFKPRLYYQASRDADWAGKFTPSFRLWFSLVALTFFFQFFWARPDSAIVQDLAAQIEAGGRLPEGISSLSAALTFSRWYYGLLPFSIAGFLSFLALIYRAFGQSLNYIERQRRIFITVIPSAIFTIFATTIFGLLSQPDFVMPLFFATLFIALILDSLTAWRGAFPAHKPRFWRAIALGSSITVFSFIAAMSAQILTVLIIAIKFA